MTSFKKNLTSVYAVNIFNGVMGVGLVPLSLKFLGVEGYGLFSIYTVIASFVALLDAGIGKSLQRALSADQEKKSKDRNVSVACGAYLLVLALVAIACPAFLVLIPTYLFPVDQSMVGSLRLIIFFACLEYALFIPLAINQSICFANEDFGKHAKFTLWSGIARYLILFVAIYLLDSVVAVVGIYVMRRLFDQYLSSRILGSLPKSVLTPIFKISELREMAGHAVGLSATRLLQTVSISIGSILVNRSFGLEALGFYRAAFDLASKVWFVSNGIGLIIYPRLVKAFTGEADEKFFSQVKSAMLISWIAFLAAASFASGVSSWLLPKLHVSNETVISLFIPLVVGMCINAHANLGYEVLQAVGKYRALNMMTIFSIFLMGVSYYLLKPKISLIAVGWAWLISQIVYALITDLAALKKLAGPTTHRVNDILMRSASLLSAISCVIAIEGKLDKGIFFVAFALQLLMLIFFLFKLMKQSVRIPNA